MATVELGRATLEDLHRTEGKAELIGGTIVRLMPTGRKPNRIAFCIARALDDHAEATGVGEAYTDNRGFTVPELSSGRRSFSPDASYYDGPFPENQMRFIHGPPTFAAEVRSESDYGETAEEALAAKRAGYFAAGTLAVWDMDLANACIRLYRRDEPDAPIVFSRGEMAHAESAVPGWRVEVDRILS